MQQITPLWQQKDHTEGEQPQYSQGHWRAVVRQRELLSMLPPFPSLLMVNTDNFLPSIMFTSPMSLQGILLLCKYQFNVVLKVDSRTEQLPRTLLQKVEFLELYYMKERERALELIRGGCHRASYLFLVVVPIHVSSPALGPSINDLSKNFWYFVPLIPLSASNTSHQYRDFESNRN